MHVGVLLEPYDSPSEVYSSTLGYTKKCLRYPTGNMVFHSKLLNLEFNKIMSNERTSRLIAIGRLVTMIIYCSTSSISIPETVKSTFLKIKISCLDLEILKKLGLV